MIKINVKNKPCPIPVIETKKAIEANPNQKIEIELTSVASKENVLRFLKSQNYESKIISENEDQYLIEGKPATIIENVKENNNSKLVNKVIYVADNKIGTTEDLGKLLLRAFIATIKEADEIPNKIIFVNKGVEVTCDCEDAILDLKELAEMGVEIYSCGTCLNYFGKIDSLGVGKIGNAYDTMNALQTADSVIRL